MKYALVAAGIAGIALGGWWHAHVLKTASFFSEALKSAAVEETVFIHTIPYQVSNGAVTRDGVPIAGLRAFPALKLAYAKTLAARSPYLALAGTDPTRLRAATEHLRAAQEKQADLQENKRSARLVRSALYPLQTLDALADLEEKRSAFVTGGSDEQQRAYNRAVRSALQTYRADLTRFRAVFERVIPENAPEYIAGDRLVTRTATLEALEALARGIGETHHKLRNRDACLSGNTAACISSDLQYPPPVDRTTPTVNTAENRLARTVQSIYDTARATESVRVEMPKGVCTAAIPGPGVFALQDALPAPIPLYLGDILLVPSHLHDSTPFYALFAQQGLDYAPVQPFASYVCPEFAEEVADLLTVRAGDVLGDTASTPLSFALQEHNRSADFDIVVHHVARVAHSTANSGARGAGTFDAMTLFYTRSAFLALFLAHNQSVAGLQDRFFPPADVPRDEQPFGFYSELPSHRDLNTALIKSIEFFDELHGN